MEFIFIMLLILFQQIKGELTENPKPRHSNPRIKARLTVKGSKCIFPFTYRGIDYMDCAPGVTQLSPWCAISLKDDYGHTVEDWEICAELARVDDKACKSLDQDDCRSQNIRNLCPLMCSAGVDDNVCKSLDRDTCLKKTIKKICPQMCSAGIDDKVCKSLEVDDCQSKGIKKACPQLCSAALCDPECINGKCSGPDECTCNDKWSGDHCDKRICDNGWIGDRCDEPVCDYECVNGQCISPNQCSCRYGWEGHHCDINECSSGDGFFRLSTSTQCFKAYHQPVNWDTAKSTCEAAGLVLAEPSPEINHELQGYLASHYDGMSYWLNGRGDGDSVRWQRQGAIVAPGSGMWMPDRAADYAKSRNDCLGMSVVIPRDRGKLYWSYVCSHAANVLPLCERILN